MSTLLNHSSRPLWVWVLVIVIGSLFIISAAAWLARLWIVRRRARSDIELISDEPAEKVLTLRRGRIVPATSYLSLTGSRFGVASYGADEHVQSPSVRSKSPFEWWTNLKGRSSRLSYVSHLSSVQYQDVSRTGSIYQRPDLSTSKLSLTSKDDSIRATMTEITLVKPQTASLVPPFTRSSRNFEPVNFSRSFTPQTQNSLVAFRNQTLSRIEETTPRLSVFSTTSLKARAGSTSTNDNTQLPDHPPSGGASDNSYLKVPPLLTDSRRGSGNSSRLSLQQQYEHNRSFTDLPPSVSSSPYMSHSPITTAFPMPPTHRASVSEPSSISLPRQSRSLWESSMKQFPWLEQHQEQQHQHRHDSTNPASPQTTFRGSNNDDNAPVPIPQTQLPPHTTEHDEEPERGRIRSLRLPIEPQLPIGPLSARSKKGNVLRKKSLERTKILSVCG